MEIGHYGWSQKVDTFQEHVVFLERPVPVTSHYGLLSLGDGLFDGSTNPPAFLGDANGTVLAVNTPASYIGRFLECQSAGSIRFAINFSGRTYIENSTLGNRSQDGLLNIGKTQYNGNVGEFSGSSSGTIFAMNVDSGFVGNVADWQKAGVSVFSVDSTGVVTAGGNNAPFPLTNSITKKASDSTMTSNTAFVDGPTVSCVAGTWLLIACCTVVCGSTAGTLTGKLWDGTTVICSSETRQTASQASSLTLAGVVSPGGTTTYKMSVATTTGATAASTLKAAAVNNGAGNNATWITAARIG